LGPLCWLAGRKRHNSANSGLLPDNLAVQLRPPRCRTSGRIALIIPKKKQMFLVVYRSILYNDRISLRLKGQADRVLLLGVWDMKDRIMLVIMVGVLAGAMVLLANTPAKGG